MAGWYQIGQDSVTLSLHVQPGAKTTSVAGLHGNALKIRLAAPPADGKANEALRAFVAEIFGEPLRNVVIKQGSFSRHKLVEVTGDRMSVEAYRKVLQEIQNTMLSQ